MNEDPVYDDDAQSIRALIDKWCGPNRQNLKSVYESFWWEGVVALMIEYTHSPLFLQDFYYLAPKDRIQIALKIRCMFDS